MLTFKMLIIPHFGPNVLDIFEAISGLYTFFWGLKNQPLSNSFF